MWEKVQPSFHDSEFRCEANTSVYIREWRGQYFVWKYGNARRPDISDPYLTFEAAKLAAELMYL